MPRPTNTQFAVAVHVLTYLADVGAGGGTGRPISSDELAGSTNANPVHIRKLLGPLRTAGLVRSRPGALGGWELCRPAGEIRLDEVWDVLQGGDPVLGLHEPRDDCPVGRSIQAELAELDRQVLDAVRRELAGHTVADLAAEAVSAPPR